MPRPTNCDKETIELAIHYAENFEEFGHAIPSVVGLCKVINRARSSVYLWAGIQGNEFADILERINEYQEFVVLDKSLKGDYNPTIAKLVLGKHGYRDESKVVSTTRVSAVTELTPSEAKAINDELENEF